MAMPALHSVVGMSLVRFIPNPFISISLAFLSHFVVDLYPENTEASIDNLDDRGKIWWMVIIEGLMVAALLVVCVVRKEWMLILAAFMANFPDLIEEIYRKVFKKGNLFFCHHNGWFPFKINFSWQGFSMRPLQTAFLDLTFVTIISLFLFL